MVHMSVILESMHIIMSITLEYKTDVGRFIGTVHLFLISTLSLFLMYCFKTSMSSRCDFSLDLAITLMCCERSYRLWFKFKCEMWIKWVSSDFTNITINTQYIATNSNIQPKNIIPTSIEKKIKPNSTLVRYVIVVQTSKMTKIPNPKPNIDP